MKGMISRHSSSPCQVGEGRETHPTDLVTDWGKQALTGERVCLGGRERAEGLSKEHLPRCAGSPGERNSTLHSPNGGCTSILKAALPLCHCLGGPGDPLHHTGPGSSSLKKPWGIWLTLFTRAPVPPASLRAPESTQQAGWVYGYHFLLPFQDCPILTWILTLYSKWD